jgi:hypothetical protein
MLAVATRLLHIPVKKTPQLPVASVLERARHGSQTPATGSGPSV